ncbi:MAG: hypothetical protein GEV04_06930 [Actinophytocola sp.]|nr:hypothetical protein [Actinophytocola sp.]
MSRRPIMDAGPGINFLSDNKERLLFSTLGALSVPEAVETEILRKAGQDQRFAAAGRVCKKLPERLMEVLSDDVTHELSAAVQRISGLPLGCRAAATEARRLQRLQADGKTVGSIGLIHTVTVLERAAGGEHLPDKNAMRDLYGRLRNLDDGLPPLDTTNLLNLPCWQ